MWACIIDVDNIANLYQDETNDLLKVKVSLESRNGITCSEKLIHEDNVKASK